MLKQRLYRLGGNDVVNASRQVRTAPVTEQKNRLVGTVDFDPGAKRRYVIPLEFRSNDQRRAIPWCPAQTNFHNVLRRENAVATCLE